MNLDKFRDAWKADATQINVSIDTESLTKEVQQAQKRYRQTIFWRDVLEIGGSLVMIPLWLLIGSKISLPWTWYLTIPAFLWIAGFLLVDRRRHPYSVIDSGQSLLGAAKESLSQLERQIWLSRNVFWWYLFPFCLSIMAFFLHVAFESSGDWWEFTFFGGGLCLFLVVVYWGVYRMNQHTVRDRLEPRRQDLLRLVDNLEGDDKLREPDSVVDFVAAIKQSDPWQCWAENWNRIIPSWRTVIVILVPTIAGALGGLYSGLRLQIPEMGPTLFQTVVGAVIPFEVVFFWIWWRSSKKHKRSKSKCAENASALDSNLDKPEDMDQPRLPKAPAIFVIFLILFLSTMAVVAIAACLSYFDGDSSTADAARLSEPEFRDVSRLADEDVLQIDDWLQSQVARAKYPSLSVAVVRHGEIVYGRSIGFENVKSKRMATQQTQYHVASVSKVFTASLAVLLDEQGVVDLDRPVVQYLPKDVSISTKPELGAKITLRQLASHTSGLPRRVPGQVQSAQGWYELEPKRLYNHLAKVELDSDPGTKELYSNLAFGLLGHALEVAAKKPLNELLQEMICNPLKLERTAFQVDDKLQPATGYDDSGWYFEKTHSFQRRLAGSGGLVTSAEDLAKFLTAQTQNGVFTSKALRELHTRTKLLDESTVGTAIGWSIGYNKFVGRILEKNGGRNNCSAWIGFSPEHKIGVVVLTNCGGPDVDRIGHWLLERITPGAYKLTTRHGFVSAAPYTAVRWENNLPVVRVQGEWFPLVSINDIPVERIIKFAEKEHGGKARKRIAEDLVQLLFEMGQEPDWEVTLGLKQQDGQTKQQKVLMTKAKRDQARDYHKENN